ncbi:MAG: hypothetical protein ACT6QS_09660 [Flavobacteriales bacterium]
MKTLTYPIILLLIGSSILLSSCKKEDPQPPGNPTPGSSDTLSGAWERFSPNLYGQGNIQRLFEVNGGILCEMQAQSSNHPSTFSLFNGSALSQLFAIPGNDQTISTIQLGSGELYTVADHTTSTGGFGATYNYAYVLYRVGLNGGSALCSIPNPANASLHGFRLWIQDGQVYAGGSTGFASASDQRLQVFRLQNDSMHKVLDQPVTRPASVIPAANGAYFISYALNNGSYSDIGVQKYAGTQLQTLYSNVQSNAEPVVAGNTLYFYEIQPGSDPAGTYVRLTSQGSSAVYYLSKGTAYTKFFRNTHDALYSSVAYANHAQDNNFVIFRSNGQLDILPQKIKDLPQHEQLYMQVSDFWESPSYYYRVSTNGGQQYLFRLPK